MSQVEEKEKVETPEEQPADETPAQEGVLYATEQLTEEPSDEPEEQETPTEEETESAGESEEPEPEEGEEEEQVATALEDFDFGGKDFQDLTVNVKVDHETKAVSLGEVVKSYQIAGAGEKRLAEANALKDQIKDERQQQAKVWQERLATADQREDLIAEGKYLDRIQAQLDQSELKTKDPASYSVRMAEIDRARLALKDKIGQVEAQIAESFNSQNERLNQELSEKVREETEKLIGAIPELAKKGALEKWGQNVTDVAKDVYGFSEQDIKSVVDHRVLMVLNDAVKFQQGQQKVAAQKKRRVAAPKTLKPGAKTEQKPKPKDAAEILYG